MNTTLAAGLFLLTFAVSADVFKCELADGNVVYQAQACSASASQKQLTIQSLDPKKYQQAKIKLTKDLQQRQELEARREAVARKKKALELMELRAQSQQELVQETRRQTEAIEKNTEAMAQRNYSDRVFYFNPLHKHPVHPIAHPKVKGHAKHSAGRSAEISVKATHIK